jgi:glutamate-ammonia-ligase adenylyltransferase
LQNISQNKNHLQILKKHDPVLLAAIFDQNDDLGGHIVDFLEPVAKASPFLCRLMLQDHERLVRILSSHPEDALNSILYNMKQAIKNASEEKQVMQALRHSRAEVMLILALSDLSGYFDVMTVTRHLSTFADDALQGALKWLWQQAAHKGQLQLNEGQAFDQKDFVKGYTVLGMGKLGAFELNYSSDIDLIVMYDQATAPLADDCEAERFFIRLTRKLMQLMHENTEDGFVFRTDLRLRPDPSATPLALSLDAALMYYESLALNWERAAMIKARPVAGDLELGAMFQKEIKPFVWRRTMDYHAIQDIRAMKRRIEDVKNLSLHDLNGFNVKLGSGGIRDIEFFVQTQQLISAGRDPSLRVPQTMDALDRLCARGWIDDQARQELQQSYCFLRNVEHRIQLKEDRQAHCLPENEQEQAQIAFLMGYNTVDRFRLDVQNHLQKVKKHTHNLFDADENQTEDIKDKVNLLSFEGPDSKAETVQSLRIMGFDHPEKCEAVVKRWVQGHYPSLQSQTVRNNLLHILPTLLKAFAKTGHGDSAVSVFDQCLKSLPTGLQMFALLEANPQLCQLLALIMGTAPRLSSHIGRHPFVLAEVMQPDFFTPDFQTARWQDELEPYLQEAQSFEDVLDRARLYGQSQHFQIGVRYLTGLDDAIATARHYSALAQTLIQALFQQVLKYHQQRFGTLEGLSLAVLAMGRLGSREMRATSDLDLILIYRAENPEAHSDGGKTLSVQNYVTRIIKTLITALSAPTARGKLYDVDTRLRPSGNAGPLATSLEAFEDYQANHAWTWEHMALTRGRCVAGDPDLIEKIHAVRHKILQQDFETPVLLDNVNDMRQRLAKEKPPRHNNDLKNAQGGLTDLDFIIQTLQLTHGRSHSNLINHYGADIFDQCEDTILPNCHSMIRLKQIYILYSELDQAQRLCMDEPRPFENSPDGFLDFLIKNLDFKTTEDLENALAEARQFIHTLYQDLIINPVYQA